MEKFDVIVIGSGPGGYVAAIRCAQLGMKTAIVEKYPTLGGTCLNVGCIPSKALLDSSEHFFSAAKDFAEHGIEINPPKVNITQMIERKRKVVKVTCDGIKFLMKKNNITVVQGHASFLNNSSIEVNSESEKGVKLEGEKIIIATGSKPVSLPGIIMDKTRIITSTEALELKEIPKHLMIIGGGVIGLEIGSVYARLGAKVSVVEFMDTLIPTMDRSLGTELQRILRKNLGFTFYFQHKVSAVKNTGTEVKLTAENAKGEKLELSGDYCLMCVGRKPYTENLKLDNAGIKLDAKGRIETNEHLQTNIDNIYAIGDVVKGAMLAHKAEEEGVYVAELLSGQKPHIDYNLIPGVVYTWPEVAAVGQTEEQLKEKGITFKTGTFPFKASGRARASMDTDGFVKMIADANNDEILGVHIIGPRAADMIGEAVVAMEYKASAEDIARICHAHPTYSEAMKEAALDATSKRAIHI